MKPRLLINQTCGVCDLQGEIFVRIYGRVFNSNSYNYICYIGIIYGMDLNKSELPNSDSFIQNQL